MFRAPHAANFGTINLFLADHFHARLQRNALIRADIRPL